MYVNIAEPWGIFSYFLNENPTIPIIQKLINEGDICIDIGANMGGYAFSIAPKVGSTGKVFVFEPQPNYFQMINDSIQVNKWSDFVLPENKALWDSTGKILPFYISQNPNNSGTSSLVNHGVFVDDKKMISVETITLSDFLKSKNIKHCNFIKIDVE